MISITCIDKDGQPNNFKCCYEKDYIDYLETWKFTIFPENEIYADFFFLSAQETSDHFMKITMMNNHNQACYSAKGIPEKIIETLQNLSGKTIISSSNNPVYQSFNEEYRTPPATKVWERMKLKGMASYDEQKDTYLLENNIKQ